MEIIQFAFYGRDPEDISTLVYDSLHGFLIPACRIPWVDMVFHPGHPSHDAYNEMYEIKNRICKRLGSDDEDRDLEELTGYMMDYSKAIAIEMFKYGRKFQRMLDEEEKQGTP